MGNWTHTPQSAWRIHIRIYNGRTSYGWGQLTKIVDFSTELDPVSVLNCGNTYLKVNPSLIRTSQIQLVSFECLLFKIGLSRKVKAPIILANFKLFSGINFQHLFRAWKFAKLFTIFVYIFNVLLPSKQLLKLRKIVFCGWYNIPETWNLYD